ncbi:MAG: phage terminase large subunit [Ignavibacteriales bacterium]|nr:phage terminase large subunit [Ignavibacteriales bacterium]
MGKELKLEIKYHPNQSKIFFESDARYKIIAKGRRFGLTRGFANYVMEQMIEGVSPVLWVDTIYGNIERYVERYFMPVLRTIPKEYYKYRANRNDLKIGKSICDFRSADKPENIEGFGYALIVINEAGIVLKNRRLWTESIMPMIMDFKAKVLIGGTPKGKSVKKTNEKHLFYELFQKCETSNPKGTSVKGETGKNTPLELPGRESNTPLVLPDKQGNTPLHPSQEGNLQWAAFNFSSYDNPYIEKSEIDNLVMEISPMLRDQEVFGKFIDKESKGVIDSSWWKYYEREYILEKKVTAITQSWDTGFKDGEGNDYSVCTTWKTAEDGYYLIDMWRGRVEFPELKKHSIRLYELFRPNEILIEDKASGQSLIQELQRETRLPIKAVKVDKDKIARVHAITPLIEAGRVKLPVGESWVKDLVNECEDFPDGEFDDVVDSVSQFLNYCKTVNRAVSSEIRVVSRERTNERLRRKVRRASSLALLQRRRG